MNPFLLFALKLTLISGVAILYYYAALRNHLFHQWNRIYLLLAMLLSLLLPFAKIEWLLPAEDNTSVIRILQTVQGSDELIVYSGASSTTWLLTETLVWAVYIVISFIFLMLLAHALLSLSLLMKTMAFVRIGRIRLYSTTDSRAPFSFFRNIFWHKEIDIQSDNGQQILKHEMVHVDEGHSWDKLFMQLVTTIFWFNPFFWLLQRELRVVHEFIADRKAFEHHDVSRFAAMMLTSAYPSHAYAFTNPFFHQSIKRRIAMLQKLSNPRVSYISRLLCLPLIVLIAAAFTLKPVWYKSNAMLDKTYTVVIDAGHGYNGDKGAKALNGMYENDLTLAIARMIKEENNNSNIKIILTRNDQEEIDLKGRVKIANEAGADVFVSIHAGAHPDKNRNGFDIYVRKQKDAASTLLGSIISKELSYVKTKELLQRQNTTYVLDSNKVSAAVLIECGYITNASDLAFITNADNQKRIAHSILKGIEDYLLAKEKGFSTLISGNKKNYMDTLPKNAPLDSNIKVKPQPLPDGSKIKEINILPNRKWEVIMKDGTVKTYNEGEVWGLNIPRDFSGTKRNIPIHSVQFRPNNNTQTKVQINGIDSTQKPLLLINAEIYPFAILDQISPDDIQEINVLKGETAVAKWGEKAKSGAIEVVLKPGVKAPSKNNPSTFKTKEGDIHVTNVTVTTDDNSNNSVGQTKASQDYGKVFTKTEVPPQFAGGTDAWRKFLQPNLKAVTPLQ
jgi:N-acetylmuramoyl-L-alanine amidase